jgi:hypothetical protein
LTAEEDVLPGCHTAGRLEPARSARRVMTIGFIPFGAGCVHFIGPDPSSRSKLRCRLIGDGAKPGVLLPLRRLTRPASSTPSSRTEFTGPSRSRRPTMTDADSSGALPFRTLRGSRARHALPYASECGGPRPPQAPGAELDVPGHYVTPRSACSAPLGHGHLAQKGPVVLRNRHVDDPRSLCEVARDRLLRFLEVLGLDMRGAFTGSQQAGCAA